MLTEEAVTQSRSVIPSLEMAWDTPPITAGKGMTGISEGTGPNVTRPWAEGDEELVALKSGNRRRRLCSARPDPIGSLDASGTICDQRPIAYEGFLFVRSPRQSPADAPGATSHRRLGRHREPLSPEPRRRRGWRVEPALDYLTSSRNRALLREFIATDFKLRYQGSVLGYAWSLARPLLLFGILSVVFGVILRIGDSVPHYSIYLLLGIVLWSFFTEATTSGLLSIVSRGDILSKIAFPKSIVIISATISALINFAISMIIVVGFLLFQGVSLTWTALMVIPLALELYVLALSLAFFLAAFFVKYRDASYIWEVVLQAGFYAIPIIYPLNLVISRSHLAAELIMVDPLAQIIQDARYGLVTSRTSTLTGLWHTPVIMLVPLGIVGAVATGACLYYRRHSKYFAELL